MAARSRTSRESRAVIPLAPRADLFLARTDGIEAITASLELKASCDRMSAAILKAWRAPDTETRSLRFLYREFDGFGTLVALYRPPTVYLKHEYIGRALRISGPGDLPILLFGLLTRPEAEWRNNVYYEISPPRDESLERIEDDLRRRYPPSPMEWLPGQQATLEAAFDAAKTRQLQRLFITGEDHDRRLLAATALLALLRANLRRATLGLTTIAHVDGDPMTETAVICCQSLPADANDHVVVSLDLTASSSIRRSNFSVATYPKRTPVPIARPGRPALSTQPHRTSSEALPPPSPVPATASRTRALELLDSAQRIFDEQSAPAPLLQALQSYFGPLDEAEARRGIEFLLDEGEVAPEARALVLGGSRAAFEDIVEPESALASRIEAAFDSWPNAARFIYVTRILRARRTAPLGGGLQDTVAVLIDWCARPLPGDPVPAEMRVGFLQAAAASDRVTPDLRRLAVELVDALVIRESDRIRPSVLVRALARSADHAHDGSAHEQARAYLAGAGVVSGLCDPALAQVTALALFRATGISAADAYALIREAAEASPAWSPGSALESAVRAAGEDDEAGLEIRGLLRGAPHEADLHGDGELGAPFNIDEERAAQMLDIPAAPLADEPRPQEMESDDDRETRFLSAEEETPVPRSEPPDAPSERFDQSDVVEPPGALAPVRDGAAREKNRWSLWPLGRK